MPGAPAAGTPVCSDTEKKMVLYRLMLPAWCSNFDASGNVITDAACTWNDLVTHVNSQERWENRRLCAQGGGHGRGSPGRGRGVARQGRGVIRRQAFQGGRPAQRFRPNGHGQAAAFGRGQRVPFPVACGGRGCGHGAYPGCHNGGGCVAQVAGQGRGCGAGRGRGGRFAGRGPGGRFGYRNREARALQQDPGYAARPGRQTRNGQAHMLDEGAGQCAGNEDMDQGGRDDNRQEQGNECEVTCHGEEHEGEVCDDMCEPFDECGAHGDDLMEGHGDY